MVVFVVSLVAVNAASLMANALAFRWIDPASMGVWHTLLLLSSYLTVVRLGLINGMGRELPYAFGSGDVVRAHRIAATSLACNIACSAVVGLTFVVLLGFLWSSGIVWRTALAAMVVVSATNLYLAYLQATFRSDSDFARLARVHWVHAGVALTLPVMVYAFGFTGLCLHAAVQAVAVARFAHALRPLRVRPRLDTRLARTLVATGMPLFVASYVQVLAMGFDRVILLHRGGVEMVGYYAPALAVLTAMAALPGAVSTYIYPRMSYALGQGKNDRTLRRMALGAGAASVAVTVPLAVAGWIVAPELIARFFPQYVASIPAVRWSLLAGLAWSFSPASQLLASSKAWRTLWLSIGLGAAARWMFPWLLSSVYEPLVGVALGNAVAAVFAGAVTVVLVRRVSSSSTREAA